MAARQGFRIAISWLVTVGIVGLVLAAAGTVLVLGFHGGAENTRVLLVDKAHSLIDSVTRQIDRELAPVAEQADWIVRRIAEGVVDPYGPDFIPLLEAAMAATPQVRAIGYLGLDYRMQRVSRDGVTPGAKDVSGQAWAAERLARAGDGIGPPGWLAPFWIPEIRQTVIARETPVVKQDRLIGFLYQTVAVAELSRSFAELARRSEFTPFVLYDDQWVLGHPRMANWQPPAEPTIKDVYRDPLDPFSAGRIPLPKLAEINDPVLAQLWQPDATPLGLFDREGSLTGKLVSSLSGGRSVVLYDSVGAYGERKWTVGVHASDTIAAGEIRRLLGHAAWGLAIVVLAGFLAWLVGRALARPVRAMAEAATLVRAERLDEVRRLPASFIREYDQARTAFNAMVDDLRERTLIREVFGRYVPRSVAAMLLHQNGELAPVTAHATILFVDVERFSSIAESLRPAEIVAMLNAYFSEVVAIIERHGGVVTQFQGDAVLAIFNVPMSAPDHAERALRSAIEIRRAILGGTFAGHRLACRIGVTTGEVVAGSVGARGRMSYTVHGDAVNLAARLEQMNKELGTRILVAAETVAEAKGIPVRAIGAYPVRGKREPVQLYVIDEDESVTLRPKEEASP